MKYKSVLKTFTIIVLLAVIGGKTFAAILSNDGSAPPTEQIQSQTNRDQIAAAFQHVEKLRNTCIESRRLICGKILQVLPGGLVVESGYTNLLREPLIQSWLVPGRAQASRAENLLEEKKPGAICIGLVFLTDFPKGKRFKPAQYDYVIIQGYPAGQYTYTSAANIKRTVRRFSAGLDTAIQLNLKSEPTGPAPAGILSNGQPGDIVLVKAGASRVGRASHSVRAVERSATTCDGGQRTARPANLASLLCRSAIAESFNPEFTAKNHIRDQCLTR
jgi:hypothetical protein